MRLEIFLVVCLFAGCLGPTDSVDSTSSTVAEAEAEQIEPTQTDSKPSAPADDAHQTSGEQNVAEQSINETAPLPPPPIHWEGNFGMVALPETVYWEECGVPLTGCNGPIFGTEGTFDIESTLTWDLPTNDLDLVLCKWVDMQCEEISRDGANNATDLPTTKQVLRYSNLPPGWYRLWVIPQHGVNIECEVDAVFTLPET